MAEARGARPFEPLTDRELQELAQALARKLRRAVGEEELAGARFLPIPRGGHLALGLLAYALGLHRSRLSPPDGPGPWAVPSPLTILVDDVALSGARCAEAIASLPGDGPVVFAHLLSPEPLRRALQAAEPRVACVAGRDLAVLRELRPEEEERYRRQLPGRRYWLGITEPVAFPWSEPERPLFHPETGRIEDGWRLAPPHRVLASRVAARLPEVEGPRGALGLGEGALWRVDGDAWELRRSGDGPVWRLDPVGADMVRGVLAYGDLARTLDFLAGRYDAPLEALRRDLEELVDRLVEAGLLSRDASEERGILGLDVP